MPTVTVSHSTIEVLRYCRSYPNETFNHLIEKLAMDAFYAKTGKIVLQNQTFVNLKRMQKRGEKIEDTFHRVVSIAVAAGEAKQ